MKDKLIKILNKIYKRWHSSEKSKCKNRSFLFFFLWRLIFKFYSFKKVNKKLILFVANNDNKLPYEYENIFKRATDDGYKCICLYKPSRNSRVHYKNTLNQIRSDLAFEKYYAQAHCVFLYDCYLPAYANKPRKNTHLVQLWHTCGALKKWGYSISDTSWGERSSFLKKYRVHQTYTDVVTSSQEISKCFQEAFNCESSKIKPIGVARTDELTDFDYTKKQKELLLEKYPQLKDKKLILWAPTYRKKSLNESGINFIKLRKTFGDEYAFLIKLHPHNSMKMVLSVKENRSTKDFIVDISREVSTNMALCSADILISDYSTMIFDFSLFERPMIFYAYDLDEYDINRTFYYDYASFVPGKIAKNTSELIECIKDCEVNFDKQKIVDFKNKYMNFCDGHATDRILKMFVKN